jgi:hypothetical protein
MLGALHDTPTAYILRKIGLKKWLNFPEEQADFDLGSASDGGGTIIPHDPKPQDSNDLPPQRRRQRDASPRTDPEKTAASAPSSASQNEIVIVDWYGKSDPANPINRSSQKKLIIAFIINYCSTCLHQFTPSYNHKSPNFSEYPPQFPVLDSSCLS